MINEEFAFVIQHSAMKHWKDEDCPYNQISETDYHIILANMALDCYYGCAKEESDKYAGDRLFYTVATDGVSAFEAEIGITKEEKRNVYGDEGEVEVYKSGEIFHAMIPRTEEIEISIEEHIQNGARILRGINDGS